MARQSGFYWENWEVWMRRLEREYPHELMRTMRIVMTKVMFQVLAWARGNTPVDTGMLRARTETDVQAEIGWVEGTLGYVQEYAPYVEKPGRVRGVGRRPFMEPAFMEHIEWIFDQFLAGCKLTARRLGF